MSNYTVQDLAKFIKQQKDREQPFVLFTGAGCSKSAGIPLASELVDEINKNYSLELKSLSDDKRKDYGHCMSVLGKDERRELIQGYINNAKINWTHLVLGLLMKEGYISRVLTFNFDNLLARSCGMLGLYPATYDFTAANLNLQNLIIDPAIVHLHGQSHGFNQLNTGDETSEHAKKLGNFISNTLNQSPSLFIGYSGQADAFFPELAKMYCSQHRLFWSGREETPPTNIKEILLDKHSVAHYIQAEDSDRFLIELAQELDCFPPKIFENPYGHLLEELNNVIPFPMQESSATDLLTNVKEELQKSKQRRKASQKPDLQNLLMKGRYEEIIEYAESEKSKTDVDTDKQAIAWAYLLKGNVYFELAKITKNTDEATTLYQQCFDKYEKAIKAKPDKYEAFNNWGAALSDLAQITENKGEATALFQQCFDKYEKALEIKPDQHQVFNNWGAALSGLAEITENTDEATILYQQCFDKYEKAIEIEPDKHDAFYNWGVALSDLAKITKNKDEATAVFQQCFDKYEKAIEIKPDKHDAFNNWGTALSGLAEITENKNEAAAFYLQCFDKYEKAIQIKPDKDEAFYNWGAALSELAQITENKDEATTLYQLCFNKYEKAIEIKPDKHEVFNNWGGELSDLAKITKNKDEAYKLYEQCFDKYEKAIEIKPDKDEAFYNWGTALSELAQITENKNEATTLYQQCFDKYEKSIEIKPDQYKVFNNWGAALSYSAALQNEPERSKLLELALDKALQAERINKVEVYNLACILALLGKVQECYQKLLVCEQAGTLPDKAHLNKDGDLDSIRHTLWFKELLQRID